MRRLGAWLVILLLLPSLSVGEVGATQFDASLEFRFMDGEDNLVPGACLFGTPISATFSVCDNQSRDDLGVKNAATDEEPTPGIIRVSGHYSGGDVSMEYEVSRVPPGYHVVFPAGGVVSVKPVAGQLKMYKVILKRNASSSQEPAGSDDGVCMFGADCNGNTATDSEMASCTVVELYPGYPGYRGVLPGLVGKGDTACLADLERMDPSFSKNVQDAANRQMARQLGIAGDMLDWTWEIWMAIGAERGYGYFCYSCIWLSDQLVQPIGPPLQTTESDPRRQLMYPWSNSFLLDFGTRNGIPQYNLDRVTDGEVRVLASLMYEGYPTATELQWAAESILGSYFGVPGYSPGYRDYAYAERQIVCRGGHVWVPLSAHPDDRSMLTYFGLFIAAVSDLTGGAPPPFLSFRLDRLDSQFTEWKVQTYMGAFAGDFAQYMESSLGIQC